MRTGKQTKRWAGMLAVSVSLALSAQAGVVLEHDFRTVNGSTVTGMSTTGSDEATLVGTASVNTGPSGITGQWKQSLEQGALTVSATSGDYLVTAGADGEYRDYYGVENFSSGTFVTVFKPAFSGVQSTRRWIMSSEQPGYPDHIGVVVSNGGYLSLGGGRAGGPPTENTWGLNSDDIEWDSSKWYYMAFSWQQSSGAEAVDADGDGFLDGLADGRASLYVRELGGSMVASQSQDAMSIWLTRSSGFNNPIHIGTRQGTYTEDGIGDYALVQFYDTFTELGSFSELYNSLVVPEPGTIALLGIGGILLWSRRRRLIG